MDYDALRKAGRGGFEKTRRKRRELWPYLSALGYHQGLQHGFDEHPIVNIAARLCLLINDSKALDLSNCNLTEFSVKRDYVHACLTRMSEVLAKKKDDFASNSISVLALIVADVLENIQVSYYAISSMYDQSK